jgi:hypothetical protein
MGPEMAKRISLVRYYDQALPLDNRCGTIDLEPWVHLPDRTAGCNNINVMVIDWQGRMALCCNDFLVENGHGDLKTASARELWHRSQELRRDIFLGRYDLEICQICVGKKPMPWRQRIAPTR